MIETATAVAFLMSSLYGAGQANAKTNDTVTVPTMPSGAVISRDLSNPKLVEAYLREKYADAPILVEVARCESTFRQFDSNGQVIRGKVNDQDVGVMQINERYHSEDAKKLGIDIYSIEGNVAFAKRLYDKFGTSPWSSSKACWGNGSLAQK